MLIKGGFGISHVAGVVEVDLGFSGFSKNVQVLGLSIFDRPWVLEFFLAYFLALAIFIGDHLWLL